MSLARAWRRQLFGASSAALIVPSAMLAALLVLALGGGFGSIGVLGQLFAGPSLPGIGAPGGGHVVSGRGVRGFTSASLPVIPAVTPVAGPRREVVHQASAVPTVPSASRGTGAAGGAIGGTGGTVRPVTQGTGSSGSGGSGAGGSGAGGSPAGSSPGSGSSAPSPQPQTGPPPPQPTPVDTVVNVVTSVTQQLPAPVGPVATQTAQAAGSAVDNLLPQTGQP
jgi:hypothetical protein